MLTLLLLLKVLLRERSYVTLGISIGPLLMHALDMEALLTLCHLSVLLVALPRGPLLLDACVPLDIVSAILL